MCDRFFFNDTATTEIYTLSLHDALPIFIPRMRRSAAERRLKWEREKRAGEHRERAKLQQTKAELAEQEARKQRAEAEIDRKSTRLNSSHANISYAVFCLKKTTLLFPFST